MRKYVQVLLVVLSLISLVSLLIYRHEYNKLRYVLEVLNFFGTPGGGQLSNNSYSSSCLLNTDFLSLKNIIQTLSSWQRISNNVFVYSAFWKLNGQQFVVEAIAVGALNENLNFGCKLWYNEEVSPIKGEFSFSAIPRRKQVPKTSSIPPKNKGYIFTCKPTTSDDSVPIGVTFYKPPAEDISFGFIPITKMKNQDPLWNQTAICVLPSVHAITHENKLKEFFKLHQILGVKDYFVYGNGNTLNVLSSINDVNINVVPLSWNFPFIADSEVVRSIVENDCLMRTRGYFHNVAILNWQQFLVPRYHGNISRLIKDFDPEDKVSRFQLQTLYFCTEYESDPGVDPNLEATMPVIFRKNRYASIKTDPVVLVYRPSVVGRRVQKISKNIAAVHWYGNCESLGIENNEYTIDNAIKKFSFDLKQTEVVYEKNTL